MPDDSMAPTILKDDTITLIDAYGTPSPGLYLLKLSGATVLRRITSDLLGALSVCADSRPGETVSLDESKAKVLSRAVGLTRKL